MNKVSLSDVELKVYGWLLAHPRSTSREVGSALYLSTSGLPWCPITRSTKWAYRILRRLVTRGLARAEEGPVNLRFVARKGQI